ncbi:MAG: c-type cytochrome [Acetobacteraceae bacterium]|nr:c-type cytochrome [Acetobacteraceae bacterium]
MNTDDRIASWRNPWFRTAVGVTVGLALLSAGVGLIWLPRLQAGERLGSLWQTICTAAGALRAPPVAEAIVTPTYVTTRVEVRPGMLEPATPVSIGRGGTLALRCTMCHGARGMSEANTPNLAGQYPAVIYKELVDFKAGARPSAIMAPLVANLSDQELQDLAEYYAYLPRPAPYHPTGPAPRIVASGAPLRNIPPCGACHGAIDNKVGASWLEGQPASYLQAQLEAFASGARHNDITEQMRNIARQMTPQEIQQAVQYFSSQAP